MNRKRLIVPGVPRARGGGLVLPGDARRGMATLHVPAGYETGEILGYCLVPGCEREGKPFTSGQEDLWQRHVGQCARRNRDEIEARAEKHRESQRIFDPQSWDVELRAHMDKVGARMRREGRLTVKKNERGGF